MWLSPLRSGVAVEACRCTLPAGRGRCLRGLCRPPAEVPDEALGGRLHGVLLRIQYVVLRHAVDRREEHAREGRCVAMPDLAEQGRELFAHRGGPLGQRVPQHLRRPGLVAHHVAQLPEFAPLAHDLEAAADHPLEPLLRRTAFLSGADRRGDVAHSLTKDLAQEVVLAAEVVVQQPLGDPRLLGDVAHRGALVAEAREGGARGGEEALLTLGAQPLVLERGTGHGLG